MRVILDAFDQNFGKLHLRSCKLLECTPDASLFVFPAGASSGCQSPLSIGENLLRSAGIVEQAFGGITASLWDDPFEWTLPEHLNTANKITAYLNEVESSRQKGFGYIISDDELTRLIATPQGMQPIIEVLLTATTRAASFQGKAFAAFYSFTGKKPPGDFG